MEEKQITCVCDITTLPTHDRDNKVYIIYITDPNGLHSCIDDYTNPDTSTIEYLHTQTQATNDSTF